MQHMNVFDYPFVSLAGVGSLCLSFWIFYRTTSDGRPSSDSWPALLEMIGYEDSRFAYTLYAMVFATISLYIGLTTVMWFGGVVTFHHVIEGFGIGVLCFSIYIGLLGILASDPAEQLSVRTYGGSVEFSGHTWYRRWVYSLFGVVGTVLSAGMILLTDGFVRVL